MNQTQKKHTARPHDETHEPVGRALRHLLLTLFGLLAAVGAVALAAGLLLRGH